MKKIIILILFILFYYFILLQEKKGGEKIWKIFGNPVWIMLNLAGSVFTVAILDFWRTLNL